MTFAFNLKGKKIFVAGHLGMVGSAIVRRLANESCEIITATRAELDLTQQHAVDIFIKEKNPDAIIIAAAKVGGIMANYLQPVDFLIDNLQIQNNLIMSAHAHDIERVLFLGSSCIYPKHARQPIAESELLNGPLEPTNRPYALAKIAGIELCDAVRRQYGRSYVSCMPTNLYGPNDNFDLKSSHVLPALLRKAHEAKERDDKELVIWGSGTPKREFMYVDDLADAVVFLLQIYDQEGPINIGASIDLSIADLARKIQDIVGFKGELVFDTSKPDGTPRKLMDSSKIKALGWSSQTPLDIGIKKTYRWFLGNLDALRQNVV